MSHPYMPLYVADYLQDTGHLCAAEHGAYLLLIMHYWSTGSLPQTDRQLARIARMSDVEWSSIRSTIASFFDPEWRHIRIDVELARAGELSEARAKAGKMGGKASAKARLAKQTSSKGSSKREAKPNHSESYKKDSVANATAEPAAPDLRAQLFTEGLRLLAEMSGRTPDSCRSLVGRWLKLTADEALHVLAAIQDAHRNRVADPTAWITATLQARNQHGTNRPGTRKPDGIKATFDAIFERLDGGEKTGDLSRQAHPRLLSDG